MIVSIRTFVLALFIAEVASPSAQAVTTVNSANEYTYGANIGWMNWAGNTNNGAVVGGYVCSGYIYSPNVGWINLGSGAPANGVYYQNLSTNDFGVNMDSAGNLRGYAYGANVGWLNFENTGAPQVSLITGNLSGYVWGANIGWISLSNAVSYVQTLLPVNSPSGMVAWWPGNGNALDVVGGNNGTLANGVTYVSGEVQQAFNFNADSAMVLLTNSASLQLQNFTIETWLKRGSTAVASSDPNAVANNALMFGYGHNGYSFGMGSDGTLLLTMVDVSDITSSAKVTDENWHHVAVTTTNGAVVFYIDGVAYPAASYNVTYQFTTAPAIGGRADNLNQNNNDSFLGAIDELAVYNRTLSVAEIQSIYQAGAAGKNAAYYINPPTSSMSIARSGSSLTISWPNTGSYTVQQNTNLASPAGWVTSTNPISTSNGTNSITFTPAAGTLFFRLTHP